ncbi:MAG: hypothetical protein ABEJ95_01590 [Candidatus Nanohalobium sp.]
MSKGGSVTPSIVIRDEENTTRKELDPEESKIFQVLKHRLDSCNQKWEEAKEGRGIHYSNTTGAKIWYHLGLNTEHLQEVVSSLLEDSTMSTDKLRFEELVNFENRDMDAKDGVRILLFIQSLCEENWEIIVENLTVKEVNTSKS